MVHRPLWFKEGLVVTSNAPTCGINKDGAEQYVVDRASGERLDEIDDKLFEDAQRLQAGTLRSPYLAQTPAAEMTDKRIACPTYYDPSTTNAFRELAGRLEGFAARSLGELQEEGLITVRAGHGSPPSDQRVGETPYIKVSDLRAGHVNINPTNRVPRPIAESFWKGPHSGLEAYDLVSPQRASKNIGEFCVLMPGQEQVVLTKEVIVVRATASAEFDQFFLLWALTLREVRAQWDRVVLMQTNREDVGSRALEVLVPIAPGRAVADEVSSSFRSYYATLERARRDLAAQLTKSSCEHHFHIGAKA